MKEKKERRARYSGIYCTLFSPICQTVLRGFEKISLLFEKYSEKAGAGNSREGKNAVRGGGRRLSPARKVSSVNGGTSTSVAAVTSASVFNAGGLFARESGPGFSCVRLQAPFPRVQSSAPPLAFRNACPFGFCSFSGFSKQKNPAEPFGRPLRNPRVQVGALSRRLCSQRPVNRVT